MKQLTILLTVIVLLSCNACQPKVTFTQPQPADTDNLAEFPKRLQGTYVSLSNQSKLEIKENIMQRIYDYDYKFHQNQLDSNTRMEGDTLYNLTTQEKKRIKHDGDSLITHLNYTDTVFQLNSNHVLRKFRGHYFLNTQYAEESWEVKQITLSRGKLIISSISAQIDIDNLKEMMESSQDTVPPYKLTPTKKQFRKFLRKEGFSNEETFVRQK